ncbi:MAG TPA: SDR family NAD(P)-dependent oxidoreductase [Iamia sp.]|nr:SDR family NAD(P)-dependent oxidoreductase [Iamia sp.]
MKDFSDRVAAITGAASGIGRSLGLELARRGAHLALSDVDEAGLAETAERARRAGVEVTTARVDVADREAVEAWAGQVVADHGRVNLIANNAGVAVGASVEGTSYEDLEWLMGINFWGVVHGTRAFLPHLRAAGDGHVVNISSVFGLVGIPMQSAYNAAKFAVRGYTESLRLELDIERCGVSATSIHPGGIKTNIARNARLGGGVEGMDASPDEAVRDFEKLFITSPDKAARQIVRAVQLDKRRALIGPDAKAIDLLSHLPVGLHQRLVAKGASRTV